MKTKAHILVVEDKALIYKRLKMILKEHHYSVDDYAPSVEEAIGNINKKRPDLVLLDIDLQGEHNGIYLGNLLKKEYNIPFIYVTDLDDDQTFYESLQTKHDDFIPKKDINLTEEEPIVIQTKPHLDKKRLIRSIQTILQKQTENQQPLREGIMGLIGYLEDIKELDKSRVTRVPVKYEDIIFFTVKPFINENEKEETLRANYLWFKTRNGEYFFLKTSLRDIQKTLPYYFVRINESYIVNIAPDVLKGRINGSRLSIQNQEFTIKNTYKEEVKSRLEHFYY
ncbi:DNA-binding response regulator [Hanstruepera neustonica]|uniref:DNA-binding response regulator n=1 Tax=Hanstruepera neustonica TaxID=1445657 RepID=A0A2K1E2W7_9FLAO|nr:response regulator [Hanstruepera neustonica]PNQ74620.1 DNA-binding response regulator [Hanstruepera neustonica]